MNREAVLILIMLLVIAVLVKVVEFFQVSVVEADASNFVKDDLRSKYPGADIEIMTITTKYNSEGGKYLELKARVTEDAFSPCPERSHIFYNYPAQNFVPQPPEVITGNCKVCTEGICTLAFPEEAIIASHTFKGTEDVATYLRVHPDATPTVRESPDSWVIVWDSPSAESIYSATLKKDGTVAGVSGTPKPS
ncbi:MAG TPA: hypothetical protein VLD37_06945 [Candidatus Bilamarchaeum sp.]|nr:hypothetical protein [Candidatus Bilamarchaeum sp.]